MMMIKVLCCGLYAPCIINMIMIKSYDDDDHVEDGNFHHDDFGDDDDEDDDESAVLWAVRKQEKLPLQCV